MARVYSCLVRSQCSARVRTSARYHGYGAYFTFLWHNWFYNILPDPSLGLGLARETSKCVTLIKQSTRNIKIQGEVCIFLYMCNKN